MADIRRNAAITGGMLAISLLALMQAPAWAGETADHLTDAHGRAVYVLSGAACEQDCALLWAPVPAGAVSASSPADTRLVGTEPLPGGTTGATYAGKPLYYFAEDVLAGDTNGHRFEEFGAIGYLVSPSGREVGGRAPSISYAADEACGCTDAPVTIAARFATAFY